ncbi:hypothetical protein [Runella sp.]|uniref:hypothetical protein n=1 Tax=Runella sp. TaxID=1960881 RepID=UPI003D0FA6B8
MTNSPLHVLPADNDEDDRDFFQEISDELPYAIQRTTVKDGVELMQWLTGPAVFGFEHAAKKRSPMFKGNHPGS